MIASDVKSIIEKVEQLLAEEELSERTELAIQELLNVVEALCADKKSLADEIERLRKQLEAKRKPKRRVIAIRRIKILPVMTTALIRITRPKSGGSRATSRRQTTDAHSKISPSTTRLNVP